MGYNNENLIFRSENKVRRFIPDAIYYEKNVLNYELGRELLEKYVNVSKFVIDNHNNIEEMRKKENKEFPKMKRNLIIGIRKTHRFVPNNKISNYLVPYTSSGCIAMCLYCYLVCNYNKCAYLRLFVNREEMLEKIIKIANENDRELVFEIGSNSDLILENSITGNLKWTIENFKKAKKGYITFPTKFDMVDDILDVEGKENVIIRMSVNPKEIIQKVEIGTSSLENRVKAINKLKKAGYKVGILIAPVIFVENWEELYKELVIYLKENISDEVKKDMFFEVIFMTYSYIHRKINEEAFPNAMKLYNEELMTVRGKGKYTYKQEERKKGEEYIRKLLSEYFPKNNIVYFS